VTTGGKLGGLVMRKYGRVFRIFGYDAPSSFMTFVKDDTKPGGVVWTPTSTPEPYPFPEPSDVIENKTSLFLDRRYENLQVGTKLLIYQNDGVSITVDEIKVTSVDQA